MSSTITTSVITGGTNNHATSVADINNPVTDFVNPGVVGVVSLNTGSGGAGSFAVNAQATPAMFVNVKAGAAYISATPAGQTSQILRASMTADYTSYAISSNSSGSTKFDFIYLSVDPTKANNPAADASDVTSLYTSRSSISTADNGSPPTYGVLLAVVTVANGASSIANSAISDKRTAAVLQTAQTTAFFFDFIESGCIWTADSAGSTLNASMISGFIWIGGSRLNVSSVSARAFTASKDTYVDLSDNGDGTALFTYTPVTNNAASPALSAGSVRIAIIVTGSSSISTAASINQGQEDRVLPIASSIAYTTTDSLGNLICPRDPIRKLLGYRQMVTTQGGITAATLITGLSCPVIVPTGRKIKISLILPVVSPNTSFATNVAEIWEGTVGSGIQLQGMGQQFVTGDTTDQSQYAEAIRTPSSSTVTYNGACQNTNTGGGSTNVTATTVSPAYIKVELE